MHIRKDLIHSFAACFPACNQVSFLRIYNILNAKIDEIFNIFFYNDENRILDCNPLDRHLYLFYIFSAKVKRKNLGVIMGTISDEIVDLSATLYYTVNLFYPPPLKDISYQYSFGLLFPLIPKNEKNIKWPNININYYINNFNLGRTEKYDHTFLSEFYGNNFSKRYYRVQHEDEYRKTMIEIRYTLYDNILRTKYHRYNSIFSNKLCETYNNDKIQCDLYGNIVCKNITKVGPPNCVTGKNILRSYFLFEFLFC
ncbi:hypothetical protein HZS_7945 [Henneguya salminicola]|nr:hypothetical protein HZS_7945 [Henneguya salminicola]